MGTDVGRRREGVLVTRGSSEDWSKDQAWSQRQMWEPASPASIVPEPGACARALVCRKAV